MCMEAGGEKLVSKCPVFLVLNFHLPYVLFLRLSSCPHPTKKLQWTGTIELCKQAEVKFLILVKFSLDALTTLHNVRHSGRNKQKTILIARCL